MSVSIEEAIEDLTGIDLDGEPPCQIWMAATNWTTQCGKPSVVRVHLTCKTCTWANNPFLCKSCYEAIRADSIGCAKCHGRIRWNLL